MTTRIAIIEDNVANLELVRYLLAHSGYEMMMARDGSQGMALIVKERPHLVICDLQMPGMDGYQVLAQLRAHHDVAGTPIIAVTAFSMPHDAQQVMTAGFDGYISKPIEPETFVAQIEAFLPSALRMQRPAADL
jgi:two-component system cell cycle response regulator DivK